MLERLHFVLGGCVGEGTRDSDRIVETGTNKYVTNSCLFSFGCRFCCCSWGLELLFLKIWKSVFSSVHLTNMARLPSDFIGCVGVLLLRVWIAGVRGLEKWSWEAGEVVKTGWGWAQQGRSTARQCKFFSSEFCGWLIDIFCGARITWGWEDTTPLFLRKMGLRGLDPIVVFFYSFGNKILFLAFVRNHVHCTSACVWIGGGVGRRKTE